MPVSFDSNCKELEPLLLSILDKPKITAWLQKTTVDESNLHIDIFDAERTVAHICPYRYKITEIVVFAPCLRSSIVSFSHSGPATKKRRGSSHDTKVNCDKRTSRAARHTYANVCE